MSEEEKRRRKAKEMEEKRKPHVGKKGVMAKRAAMKEAAEKMTSRVAEVLSATKAQARENESAVRKIRSGVEALQGEMKKTGGDFEAYARDFYLG
jgi:hypothetical protein